MKKIAAGLAAAAAAAGIALGAAAPAHADKWDYLNDLNNAGYGNYNAADAMFIGTLACASPLPTAEQARVVYEYSADTISRLDAAYIVQSAHRYLCPASSA